MRPNTIIHGSEVMQPPDLQGSPTLVETLAGFGEVAAANDASGHSHRPVLKAMRGNMSDADLQHYGCWALANLLEEGEGAEPQGEGEHQAPHTDT